MREGNTKPDAILRAHAMVERARVYAYAGSDAAKEIDVEARGATSRVAQLLAHAMTDEGAAQLGWP